ncbi:MAG TPA: O-antigen ligase family protein [Methylomirabilota bacterium]|nr:O-antigen ligase family protein [Methylomirabilota bacterium]
MTPGILTNRNLLLIGTLVPLALLVGYAISQPLDYASLGILAMLFAVFALPMLLNTHHLVLVFALNAAIVVPMPGQPKLWMLMTAISLGLSVVGRLLDPERKFIRVPGVERPLLALAVVVVATMIITGGAGVRAFGSQSTYGGRRFYEVLIAILAYFALTAQPVSAEKANRYGVLYLLSGITAVMSNLAYMMGPQLWWLYLVFPVDLAMNQAAADFDPDYKNEISRLTGVAFACIGPYLYMIARYGVAGILDITKPWRALILLVIVAVGASGGFRSVVILFGLVFVIQFYLEGLHRTRILPILALLGLLGAVAMVPLASHLPLSIQRSMSFLVVNLGLPIELSSAATQDAYASTEWRKEMWRQLAPDLPRYLLVGKGYALNPTDLYLTFHASKRGYGKEWDNALLAGDYHNGPLSIYVPFGTFGLLAFIVFVIAGWRVLLKNYRYGPPALKGINTFLLAYFVSRVIFFFVVFGAISNDLIIFVGMVGLSISLNHGVRSAPALATAGARAVMRPARA